MKKILAVIICSGFFFACGNEGTESASSSDSLSQQVLPTPPVGQVPSADNSGAIPTPPSQAAPGAAQTAATAPGMNPPHGEPGHRCDISVGAPLNSAPNTAPAANPVVTTPSLTPAAPAPVTAPVTTTAPGMNPPHGQPGHDCAVAVGAPLKK